MRRLANSHMDIVDMRNARKPDLGRMVRLLESALHTHGYHRCSCWFYREREGETGVVYSTNRSGKRTKRSVVIAPRECGVCNSTGWCT